jgi:hypothetical protein
MMSVLRGAVERALPAWISNRGTPRAFESLERSLAEMEGSLGASHESLPHLEEEVIRIGVASGKPDIAAEFAPSAANW